MLNLFKMIIYFQCNRNRAKLSSLKEIWGLDGIIAHSEHAYENLFYVFYVLGQHEKECFIQTQSFSIIFGSGLFVCSLCKETASSCLQVSPQVLATLGDPKAFNKF